MKKALCWLLLFVAGVSAVQAADDGGLDMGYNTSWTARIFYNPGRGFDNSWPQLCQAREGDVYTVSLPYATAQQWQAQVQFKTPVTLMKMHTYRLTLVAKTLSGDPCPMTVVLAENENDQVRAAYLETVANGDTVVIDDIAGTDIADMKLWFDFGGNSGFIDVVRTIWQGSQYNNYWIRRNFTLDEVKSTSRYMLDVLHDDTYAIYVNGHLIDEADDWTIGKEAIHFEIPYLFLKQGNNVIAVYQQQNVGGKFFDCGLTVTPDYYDESDDVNPADALVANEIQVANIDRFIDHSFNYGAWLELYNTTDKTVNLGGLYLSDDPDYPSNIYNGIDISFSHALSLIEVQTASSLGANAAVKYYVQKIEVRNAYNNGTFTQSTIDPATGNWVVNTSATVDYAVLNKTPDWQLVPGADETPVSVNPAQALMLLPQTLDRGTVGTFESAVDAYLTVTYKEGASGVTQIAQIPLTDPWIRGNKYTYKIVFSSYIEFTALISDWDDEVIGYHRIII